MTHPPHAAWAAWRADLRVNRRNPKAIVIMSSFRLASSWAGRTGPGNAPVRFVIGLAHRLLVEWILGTELPWRTSVGPGLRIYHGYGIVINDEARIGSNVTMWHGVTLGNRRWPGGAPKIGDDVEIGAMAIILGSVHVGDGARVGAGAVVLESVPAGATVVGNPARIVPVR